MNFSNASKNSTIAMVQADLGAAVADPLITRARTLNAQGLSPDEVREALRLEAVNAGVSEEGGVTLVGIVVVA